MQFIADIIKNLSKDKIITKEDLYNLKETDIIKIIENSRFKDIYIVWQKAKKVMVSDVAPKECYYVKCLSKIRYIDPLVNGLRVSKISNQAKNMIDKNLAYDMTKYIYINDISNQDLF